MELVITGSGNTYYMSKLYHNDGGGQFSDVTPPGLPGLQTSSVAWGDYDGDGRLDFLISGQDSSFNGLSRLYHNDGLPANTPPGPPGNLRPSGVPPTTRVLPRRRAPATPHPPPGQRRPAPPRGAPRPAAPPPPAAGPAGHPGRAEQHGGAEQHGPPNRHPNKPARGHGDAPAGPRHRHAPSAHE